MNVVLLPPSDEELEEAIRYYDDQLEGLGQQFNDCFLDTIRYIESGPDSWKKVGEHTRRANIKLFPYLVLYVHEQETIVVTCIAHQHREPQYYLYRVW
ncbi:MAG: type II toxin-antitoxin system RelE/ParE family toxin [Bacteroidia bacterium]|nr:type II toxin-antitoxin system RelE/ParE family toxin [Bacteroidia bacterium]